MIINQVVFSYADDVDIISIDDFIVESENKNYAVESSTFSEPVEEEPDDEEVDEETEAETETYETEPEEDIIIESLDEVEPDINLASESELEEDINVDLLDEEYNEDDFVESTMSDLTNEVELDINLASESELEKDINLASESEPEKDINLASDSEPLYEEASFSDMPFKSIDESTISEMTTFYKASDSETIFDVASLSEFNFDIASLSELKFASASDSNLFSMDLLSSLATFSIATYSLYLPGVYALSLSKTEIKQYIRNNNCVTKYTDSRDVYLPTNWSEDLSDRLNAVFGDNQGIGGIQEIIFKRKSYEYNAYINDELTYKNQMERPVKLKTIGDITIYVTNNSSYRIIYIELDDMWERNLYINNIHRITLSYIYLPPDSSGLFSGFTNLKTIRSYDSCVKGNINSADAMFKDCKSLKDIYFMEGNQLSINSNYLVDSGCNYMFSECENIGNFDNAFQKERTNSFLKNLKIKVNGLEGMFYNCLTLTDDIANTVFKCIDFTNVSNASKMFASCKNLIAPHIDSSCINNISSLQNINEMFASCDNLWKDKTDIFRPFNGLKADKLQNISHLFEYAKNIAKIDLSFMHNAKIGFIERLFYNCEKLTQVDNNIINFDISNCTSLKNIFFGTKIKKLSFGEKFNTENVKDMSYMFNGCHELEYVDMKNLSNKSISSYSNIRGMFDYCQALNTILISHEFTYDIDDGSGMSTNVFYGDNTLKGQYGSLQTSYGDSAKYAKVDHGASDPGYFTLYNENCDFKIDKNLFKNLSDSKEIFKKIVITNDISSISLGCDKGFKVDSDAHIYCLYKDPSSFGANDSILYILAQSENTPIIHVDSDATGLFSEFVNVEDIEGLDYFDFSEVTIADSMFKNCKKFGLNIDEFNLNIDMNNLTNTSHMFDSCESIKKIKFASFSSLYTDDSSYMFNDCINLSTFSNIKNCYIETKNSSHLFASCKNLDGILETFEFDLKDCIDTSYMFSNCKKIKNFVSYDFNISKSKDISYMFKGCDNLLSLDTNKIIVRDAITSEAMFQDCEKLKFAGSFENFDTSHIINMSSMFNDCEELTSIDGMGNFNTASCEDMASMFDGCEKLEELNLTLFDTTKTKYFDSMFQDCSLLKTIFAAKDFDLTSMVSDINMFLGCTNLKGSLGQPYDTANINSDYARIDLGGARPGYFSTYVISDNWFNNIHTTFSVEKNNINHIIFADDNTPLPSTAIVNISDNTPLKATYNFDGINHNIYIIREMSDVPIVIDSNPYKYEIFNGFDQLIDIKNFNVVNTSGLQHMSQFFANLRDLTFVDLSALNTNNVIDMSYMFKGCENLENIDLSSFDTSNVINMNSMFLDCKKLHNISFDSFDTTKVSTMRDMFKNFSSDVDNSDVSVLDLHSFNTAAVSDMGGMFEGSKTSYLGISSFDTGDVTNMNSMFKDTYVKNQKLDLSNFNTTKVSEMSNMFEGSNLVTIYASSKFATSSITDNGTNMFNACTNLKGKTTTYDSSHVDIEYARIDDALPGYFTSLYDTNEGKYYLNQDFLNYSPIEKKDIKKIILLKSPTPIDVSFGDEYDIKDSGGLKLYLKDDDGKYIARIYASGATSTIYTTGMDLFAECASLSEIENIDLLDTSKVENFDCMFYDCKSLKTLDLSTFSFENAIRVTSMFANSTNLKSVKFGTRDKINSTKLMYMSNMFSGCNGLESIININNFSVENVTHMKEMFNDCFMLKDIDLSSYVTNSLTDVPKMFYGCSSLTSVNLSNFNTRNVDVFDSMFEGCSSLKSLDLKSFNTERAYTLNSMFAECASLSTLHIENFSIKEIKNFVARDSQDIDDMFRNCISLERIYCDKSFTYGRSSGAFTPFAFDINLKGMSGSTFDDCGAGIHLAKIDRGVYRPGYFYTDNYHTITFDLNGISTESFVKQIVPYDEETIEPGDKPKSAIYNFDYWYLNDENVKYTFGNKIMSDITLHAHYSPKKFNISYAQNGGTFNPGYIVKRDRAYGEIVKLATAGNITRDHYIFAGWYTDSKFTSGRVYEINPNLTTSITLFAKWEKVQYNINYYNIDGAYVYGDLVAKANFDETVNLVATYNVIKDGSHMLGWYNNASFAGTATTSIPAMNFANVDLYAKWYDDSFAITYNNMLDATFVGGYVASTSRFYYEKVNLPTSENIYRLGYTFDGWYDNEFYYGDPIAVIYENTCPHDMHLFAKWKENVYNIIFNGLPSECNIDFSVFPDRRAYTKPATLPTAEYVSSFEFEFLDWYDNPDFVGTPVTYIPELTATNSVVWGKFKERIFTITYNNIENVVWKPGYVALATRSYYQSVELPTKTELSRDGYEFLGWCDALDNSISTIESETFGNMILYAKWNEYSYNVTYNTNGGAWVPGFIATTSRLYHEGFSLPTSDNIVRIGYDFGSWWEDPGCTMIPIAAIPASVSVSHEVYAKWTLKSGYAQVTFDTNGGSYIYPQAVLKNVGLVTRPLNPTKSGYNFANWYKEATLSTVFDFNTATLSESTTLYAKWEQASTPPHRGGSGGGGGGGGGGIGLISIPLAPKKENAYVHPYVKREIETAKENVAFYYHADTSSWYLIANINTTPEFVKNGFYNVDNYTYYFDDKGVMAKGWVKDAINNYYLFEWGNILTNGQMIKGWKKLDDKWYYFDMEGKLLTNSLTPDGYLVDADGVWANPS